MSSINWARFSIGVVAAAAICFLTDGFIHEGLAKEHWNALDAALKATPPGEGGNSMLYFAVW